MKLRVRVAAETEKSVTKEMSGGTIRLGRDPICEIAIDPTAYPKVSGQHARIEESGAGFVLVHLSRSNKTLLNNTQIEKATPIRTGDKIRLGFTGPIIEILLLEHTPPPAAEPPEEFGETIAANAHHSSLLRGSAKVDRFEIGAGGVIGRDTTGVRFRLDHPHVSRRHARLTVTAERITLTDLKSANGTYVNGRRVHRSVTLAPDDRIDIGPFALEYDGVELVGVSRANNIELVARDIRRVVTDRATGKPISLLEDINLVVRPGEFVCLIGPSGSGKSTLLSTLSGRVVPEEGTVTLNGRDLHTDFSALKHDIAVVPQRDLLHDTLSVGQALRFTAELRLPSDTDSHDLDSSVAEILSVVGLSHRRESLIRNLSGGQLKRTSLANELLCKPSLLFLDEMTSGLDEQTDREMMALFRIIAESGKTVVCITHNLANVEAECQLVVILTEGGKLAFVGTVDEAKGYFKIDRLGDVYQRLATRPALEWKAAFQSCPLYTRYIVDRLPKDVPAAIETDESDADDWAPTAPVRQWHVLTRRYISILRGDITALFAFLGQSILVAILLALVFGSLADVSNPIERGQRTINLLFLLAVSSFWFGANNAAKEFVKEGAIFTRERDFNLRVDSYFASKFVVLTGIGLIQVTLLFGVVRLWCGPPGNAVGQWAVLSLLAVCGTAAGLLVSALARTEEVAVALVPVIVIPQIILAGVVAPLSGLAQWLAKCAITAYSGQQALEALIPRADADAFGLAHSSLGIAIAIGASHAAISALLTVFVLVIKRPRG